MDGWIAKPAGNVRVMWWMWGMGNFIMANDEVVGGRGGCSSGRWSMASGISAQIEFEFIIKGGLLRDGTAKGFI